MATVIVEQFNPTHGYWNKLYEVDSSNFDPSAPITINKYGGAYRTRTVGEVIAEPIVVKEKENVPKKVKEKIVKEDNPKKPFFTKFEDDEID